MQGKKNESVKLQYTTPRRFRVGSASKPKQAQSTNKPRIQTQNTKGFCSPRLQGAVYCNLANESLFYK